MMTIAIDQVPPLERPETTALATTESQRMAALLAGLDAGDWQRPTDCPDWDVRAMAGHVLGMVETFGSLRRFARDTRAARAAAGDGPLIDALTAVQVRDHGDLDTDELVDRLRERGPVQARWRASRRLMRLIPVPQELPDGTTETWKAGYLFDIILTRDTWMHRVDICRATGQPMELTADHDGRIVADVVAEWARRHGRPFTLHLDGPAGGTYASGTGGETIRTDPVQMCRALSGRAPGTGLLAQQVPF